MTKSRYNPEEMSFNIASITQNRSLTNQDRLGVLSGGIIQG